MDSSMILVARSGHQEKKLVWQPWPNAQPKPLRRDCPRKVAAFEDSVDGRS